MLEKEGCCAPKASQSNLPYFEPGGKIDILRIPMYTCERGFVILMKRQIQKGERRGGLTSD